MKINVERMISLKKLLLGEAKASEVLQLIKGMKRGPCGTIHSLRINDPILKEQVETFRHSLIIGGSSWTSKNQTIKNATIKASIIDTEEEFGILMKGDFMYVRKNRKVRECK